MFWLQKNLCMRTGIFNIEITRRLCNCNPVFLVKLHYFQFAFLENCVYRKTKEINKRSKEFLFKHIFLSVCQLCECSFKDMMFALLLRTEWYKFLYLQFILNISFVSSLNHQSVNLENLYFGRICVILIEKNFITSRWLK